MKDLANFKKPVILVRGLPQHKTAFSFENKHVEIKNHLPATALNKVILQSKKIICRGGYSTIMDLISLEKNAALVPTPGQTEQEYLADYLQQQQIFICADQEKFSLDSLLEKMENFEFKKAPFSKNNLHAVVEDFTDRLK